MIFKRYYLPVNLTNLEYLKLYRLSRRVGGLHILLTHLIHLGLKNYKKDLF
jgi:hypothetical protein